MWATAGVQTNPAINAILADTGALTPGGQTGVTVILGGSVAFIVTLEHRNAANDANVNTQVLAAAANDPFTVSLPGIDFASGERIRIRLNAAVTGSIQASLLVF
jgi:hypothetical protein